jgi:hypothetical protein
MATVASTTANFVDQQLVTWTPLTTTNADGAPGIFTGSGDRTVQIAGTFGAGGTVVIEGSLDNNNWFGLKDPSSTVISFTAAGLRTVLENVPYIRPRVTAGDGTTSITAIACVRRNFNG